MSEPLPSCWQLPVLHRGDAARTPSASSLAGAHMRLLRAQEVARWVRGTLTEISPQRPALLQAGDRESAHPASHCRHSLGILLWKFGSFSFNLILPRPES